MVPPELVACIERRAPVPLAMAFPPVPVDPAELDRVSIPVERIGGPVLLIAGADDRSWPSAAYSRVAADRLAAHQHPHPVELRILDGVGHTIAGPPGRAVTNTTAPGPGVTFEMGGTPAANTAGRAQTCAATVTFFRAHLAVGTGPSSV